MFAEKCITVAMTRITAKIKLCRSPAMTAPRPPGIISSHRSASLSASLQAKYIVYSLLHISPPRFPDIHIIMSSNVGLTTPRGSGTSGYVQRNLSHQKPRDNFAPYPKDYDSLKHRQRKPDKDILNHDRLREIEVKVFDLRDKLEDEGYVPLFPVHLLTPSLPHSLPFPSPEPPTNTPSHHPSVDEEEIELQTSALRQKLTSTSSDAHPERKGQFKPHEVHRLAEAKIVESEKLRKALGIRQDYEEGGHWKKQEERLREGVGEGEREGKDVKRERGR